MGSGAAGSGVDAAWGRPAGFGALQEGGGTGSEGLQEPGDAGSLER